MNLVKNTFQIWWVLILTFLRLFLLGWESVLIPFSQILYYLVYISSVSDYLDQSLASSTTHSIILSAKLCIMYVEHKIQI